MNLAELRTLCARPLTGEAFRSTAGARRTPAVDILCCLALALVTLGAFYPCLTAGFVYDDFDVVVDNPLVNGSEASLRSLFLRPFPHAANSYHVYRPLTVLSYRLNAGGGPPDAPAFHAVNLALHLGVSLLLFVFLRRAFAPPIPAFIAALLFAVMPGHAEAALWVSGRGDLLMAVATLLGFLAVSRLPRRWPPALPTLLALLGLYLAALLCKEPAVSFPGLVIVAGALGAPEGGRYWGRGRRAWAALAAFAVPLLVYGALRVGAMHDLRVIETPAMRHAPLAGRLALVSRLVAAASATLVWAPNPRVIYPWPDPLRWDWQAISGVAVAALLLAVLVWGRDNTVRGGVAIAAIAFLPHLKPIGGLEFFAERYLYVPALGFAVIVAALLTRAWRRGRRVWVASLGLAWCLLLGSQTLAYASVWADEASFWEYTHRVEPGSAKALNNFGVALARAGRLSEAKAAFSALAGFPGYELSARKALLAVLTTLGETENGIRLARRLDAMKADDPDVLFLLGECELRAGARDAARITLGRLVRLAPTDGRAGELAALLGQEPARGRTAVPPLRLPGSAGSGSEIR